VLNVSNKGPARAQGDGMGGPDRFHLGLGFASCGRTALSIAGGAVIVLGLAVIPAQAASPYIVGNYPVDGSASDAVTAKAKATAEAETGALRYLMKRLVPVGDYRRLPNLSGPDVENMIDNVAIRSEQNSGTEYIATLDYAFRVDAVRNLLVSHGLPFFDKQAPALTVIPVFAMPAGAKSGPVSAEGGQRLWRQAWSGLDLVHSLTPITLAVAGPSATNDTFLKLIAGDRSGLGVVQAESSAGKLLLAIASPSADGSKLTVALVGDDWSGPLNLKRTYTLYYKDMSYTTEWASVIALGVLEGRWKEQHGIVGSGAAAGDAAADAGWSPVGADAAAAAGNASAVGGQPIRMTVEFNSLEQWQEMRSRLADVAGPQNVQVGALSSRGAEVTVGFAGGPGALQARLATRGLGLASVDGHLVLRAAN
jgi:hypothetical protein